MVCSDTDLSLWMNFHAECVLQVEGVEKIYIRYQNIVSATKSKTYDILDHRKLEVTLELEKSFFFCSSTALQKIHIMCVCVSLTVIMQTSSSRFRVCLSHFGLSWISGSTSLSL